jgi:16S rRNA (adenine1518-N6/adenine1519-N6)-dimethyltransferase
LAWYSEAALAGNIGRNVFWPAPNVDSALVYFAKRDVALGTEAERLATFEAVDAGFSQRRKTLRQALADWAGSPAKAEEFLLAAGVNPQRRAEELTVHDFLRIAQARSV